MFRLKKEYYNFLPLLNEQKPDNNHFSGKLYVLINGASGSMASVVSSLLKANQRAIFIGEESGGTMEGNTSLAYARLLLPNTKIRVEVPLTKTVHHVDFVKGRGVFPDYSVVPEIEDVMNGIDTELNFTLELIASKKRDSEKIK
jgi:C-terminal processing protease CtpA/Prc